MTDPKAIELRGVRVHNLQGVDVDIPLRRLTVVTGVSGAGKSSLVFDTLYAEAQRRYLQSFSAYTRQFLERFDTPAADRIGDLPPAVAVGAEGAGRNPRTTVGSLTEVSDYLRLLFARAGTVHCPQCGQVLVAHQPSDVVEAAAALPAGTRFTVAFPGQPDGDVQSWVAGLLEEGFHRVQVGATVHRLGDQPPPVLSAVAPAWVLVDRLEAGRAAVDRLTDSIETAFARGQGQMALLLNADVRHFDQRLRCLNCDLFFPTPEPRLFDFNDPLGACPMCQGTGTTGRPPQPCPTCHGRRWNQAALSVRLMDRSIADLSDLSLTDLAGFIQTLNVPPRMRAESDILTAQMRERLDRLTAIDLGYLTLSRPASTLADGEGRRVRLATALSSNLAQALYVLDEPTVGLHPRDTARLLAELHRLRERGNTVVVIEHDRDVITAADHVIDLGPGAGEEGGRVTYQGPPAGLAAASEGPTADYWTGSEQIALPARRRKPSGVLKLTGATTHNLKNLTVEFPLGALCVVTGVSGAGKSSLVEETLYPALTRGKKKGEPTTTTKVSGGGQVEDVILMDQSPLPRTARSNPATYLKIFDEIRDLFAATADAKIRNLGPGRFSFNQPGGRCETCEGQGTLTVDLQFLADVTMTCPECHGRRYTKEVLDIKVRSLSITEVLDLTVREAFRFFRAQPGIERRLRYLLDVGLDYLRLGQTADTLSGGECQRLKLAGHLAASRKPRSLFLLLEPTAGLHPQDVARLLDAFDRLLAAGHSLIVVEHDLDVIRCADHVIDLGPEGGDAGGRIVAAGTPEAVAQVEASHTGRWLRRVLSETAG